MSRVNWGCSKQREKPKQKFSGMKKPKISRRKEIIEIGEEVNEIETKKQ